MKLCYQSPVTCCTGLNTKAELLSWHWPRTNKANVCQSPKMLKVVQWWGIRAPGNCLHKSRLSRANRIRLDTEWGDVSTLQEQLQDFGGSSCAAFANLYVLPVRPLRLLPHVLIITACTTGLQQVSYTLNDLSVLFFFPAPLFCFYSVTLLE